MHISEDQTQLLNFQLSLIWWPIRAFQHRQTEYLVGVIFYIVLKCCSFTVCIDIFGGKLYCIGRRASTRKNYALDRWNFQIGWISSWWIRPHFFTCFISVWAPESGGNWKIEMFFSGLPCNWNLQPRIILK